MKEWKSITLSQLQEAAKIDGLNLEPLDKQIKFLSIITGFSEDHILNLPKRDFLELLKKYDLSFSLADLDTKGRKSYNFKCGGYYWKPETDVSKFTTGMYIDCSELIKMNVNERLSDLMATISTPYKKFWFIKWKVELSFEEKCNILKTMSVADAYPLALFFCRVLIHLTNDMANSLKADVEKLMTEKKIANPQTHSTLNGVGT